MNRTIPAILAVALFMEQMDSTVIATSLPAIAADIGTDPIALKLALTAYLVSVAIFIPISGWMADRIGAKKVFCAAIAVFVVGSIACTTAGSLGGFVAARFLQGMGGAMMTPVGRLVLVRLTDKRDLVNAMAWLTIPALFGPLAGPPVGGFITTYFSWHWIFLINVPIGLAGIVLAWRILPTIDPKETASVDRTGFLLSGFAAAGIVFGLSVISLPALPPVYGAVALAAGIICTALYVRHARRHSAPLLALRLFENPSFRAAVAGASLFRIGAGAVPFLLPLMFQLAFGMTPFEAGLLTFASALGAIGLKFVAAKLLRLAGFRTILIVSSVVGAVMIAINGWFTSETPVALIIGVLFVAGFFRSLFFTSANALVFADTPQEDAAQATAISAVLQQVSIAVGVAIAGAVLEAVTFVTGEPLGLDAFKISFFTVAGLTAFAAIAFWPLDKRAGETVSGHQLRPAGPGGRTPVNRPPGP
ncbi:MAG: MFS transporter [Rhizobiaceae bacterium]